METQSPETNNLPPQDFDEPNSDGQIFGTLENKSKHWTRSKTMWFNIGVTAVGVGSAVLPFTQPFINPRTFSLLTTAVGMANMALRAVTTVEIQPKADD